MATLFAIGSVYERNSLHHYTTVYLNRDGVCVPFVPLSGRWLEAFGFKEGAKFAAVGVEGELLVFNRLRSRAERPRVPA